MATLDFIVVTGAVLSAATYLFLKARSAWRGTTRCGGCAGCEAQKSTCGANPTQNLVRLRTPNRQRQE